MATQSSSTSQFYSPEDFSSAGQAIKPQIDAFKKYQNEREPLLKKQEEASKQLATAKSEVEKTVAQAGVKAGDEYISGLENLQLQYQGRLSDNPLPTHKPTQEDLSTMAGLGSMIMTMGFLVGSGGKANAIAGLESLTGALNGWRSGRKDLWQQEMRNFEKSFAKVKADRDEIYKNLIEGQKLAATNYQAAKLKYENAARIAGANSIVTADLNKGRADQALKNLESSFKTEQGFTQQQQQMAMSLYRERQAEIRHKQNIALIRERASQGKMDNKTKSEIRGNLATLGNISDLSRMLTTVPDAAVVFGIIGGNVPENIQQLYSSPQAQQTISLLQNISSQILKLRSGATVTVAEFARQRGFLPQRQDTTEAIQNKLRGLWDAVTNETVGYGLTKKQLAETADEISQIPEPLAPSYRPTTREDKSLGTRRSQGEWKIEEVKK